MALPRARFVPGCDRRPSAEHPVRYDLPASSPADTLPTDTASANDIEGALPTGADALAPACVNLGDAIMALGVSSVRVIPVRTSGGARGYEATIGDGVHSVRMASYDGDLAPASISAVIALAASRWLARGFAPAGVYGVSAAAARALDFEARRVASVAPKAVR